MKTKTLRILLTIAMVIVTLAGSMSAIFATQQGITPNSLTPSYNGTDQIATVGKSIMGIIQTVGVVVSVIILMILGIKYMMGSAEEKAEYKKTMIPYIVGAILIFAASTIANMIYNFANGLNSGTKQ